MQSSHLKVVFIASLCLSSFGYGVASDHNQVFPFSVLQNATRALRALAGERDESDRAIVTFFLSRRIWKVDINSGEVVWECVCVDPAQHRHRYLSTAQYVRDVEFSFNQEVSE
jgi:hypothetical protein